MRRPVPAPWIRVLIALIQDDDVRSAFAAVFFFVYIAALFAFLMSVPVPDENRDTVHLIVGTLLGGGMGPAVRALLDKRWMQAADDIVLGKPEDE